MRRHFPVFASVLIAVTPASGAAQTVTGVVLDSATGLPVSGATVVVRAAKDSAFLRGAITNDEGQFSVALFRPDTVVTSVRRIGFRTVSAAPRFVPAKGAHTYHFALSAIPIALDTVRASATKVLRGMFYELTAGQEWFIQHSALGKGFFLSGAEIQLTGVTPCQLFGEMPGFQITGVLPEGIGGIGCYWQKSGPNRFIVPLDQTTCIEAYLDRKYRLVGVDSAHVVTTSPGEDGLTWRRLDRISGIEMFARYEDRPKDFSVPAPPPLTEVGGMKARVGMRSVGSTIATERPRATYDFGRGGQQRCALILLWTEKYWGQ